MRQPLIILCVLFQAVLSVLAGDASEAELAAQLKELDVARQAAEDRCLELNAGLVRTEKELTAARQQLAEALLEVKRLRHELDSLRLKAANVLVNSEDVNDAQLLTQVKTNLDELSAAHQKLYRYLLDYRQTLDSVLDVLDPKKDSSLRRLLARKQELILFQLAEARGIAEVTAGAPRADHALACRVLTVNDELNVAVLDIGRSQGGRVGSSWRIAAANGETTTCRIIDARHSISAAMVIEGHLRHVTPGATAELVLQTSP